MSIQKAMVNIGGNIWVDVESVLVVQPRLSGCAVFLRGGSEAVFGADAPEAVVQRLAMAGVS